MIPGMTAPLQGPVTMNVPFAPESASRVRAALESWLEHRGSDAEIVDDVRLIATELVGNAVRHASPLNNGTVLVRWREEDSTLVLSVADGGGPTRPQPARPTLDDVHGRGLRIVDALSKRWWVEQGNRLRTVHVQLALG
jgi:anti-sigma regulatory factor (Ser/Thr protein kinase)